MNKNNETTKTVFIIYDKNDSLVLSFVSYLVAALKRQGIDAVSEKTDPEQNSGSFLGVNLVLVVFSKFYTFSVPCLNNLLELQKFRQKKGHVVVPIFYKVNVSVIKEQMKSCEAFAVHEKSFSVDQVNKWRRVLVETIGLRGHERNNELSGESDYIEKIVEDIFDRLCPTEHIGNQKVLKELEDLLRKQPWGRRSLAILGEPGIGKTELAKAALQKMSSRYDASRFIRFGNEDIIELLSDEDFKEIPLEKFDLNEDAEPSQRPKRVLIILDDVESASDVKDFLVGFDRLGPGSLLIITTRHREVLEQCHVNDIYELKGLSNEDSLKLFTRCVFGEDAHDVDEESLKFSMEEIKHCDGNPSAILSCVEKVKSALNQFSLVTAEHNNQSDLQKLPELNLDPDSVLQSFDFASYLWDLPRFISLPSHVSDLSIPNVGQEFVLVHLPHKSIPIFDFKKIIWKSLMIDQTDLPDFTNTLLTDQLDPKILNLRGCIEIKHFQELVKSIGEWCFEGKILQYRLQRDDICTQCNSANDTGSHLYFDITFSWSNLTTLRHQIQSWEVVLFALLNLTGSKAKKILSQMEWQLTVYTLSIRRRHRLYRQSYRSSQVHRFIRYIYVKRRRLKRRLDFFLKYFNSADLELLHPTEAL